MEKGKQMNYLEGHIRFGMPASEYCHKDHGVCDGCDKTKDGTMMYAQGATGRICAVMFLCDECDNFTNTDKNNVPTFEEVEEKLYEILERKT